VDNGNNKIDVNLINNGISATDITINFTNEMTTAPCHYSLLHYQDPDATGHSSSWSTNPASAFATTLKQVDNAIGVVLDMIGNSPVLNGRTAIILTADHGGHDKTHGDMSEPLDYTIPFYIWGPGVTAGADLYSLNPTTRRSPGTSENTPYTGPQPIRNGDAVPTPHSIFSVSTPYLARPSTQRRIWPTPALRPCCHPKCRSPRPPMARRLPHPSPSMPPPATPTAR
jgi:hypothetical protein